MKHVLYNKYAFDIYIYYYKICIGVPCAHGLRKKKIECHKSLTNTDFTSKFQLYFAAVL